MIANIVTIESNIKKDHLDNMSSIYIPYYLIAFHNQNLKLFNKFKIF